MKEWKPIILLVLLAVVFSTTGIVPAWAQSQQAISNDHFLEKVKADKKRIVAAHMELTEVEAKDFWPVYEVFQNDLYAINQRIARLISSYTKAYRSRTLDDDMASVLISGMVNIQKNDAELMASYVPRLEAVLTPEGPVYRRARLDGV